MLSETLGDSLRVTSVCLGRMDSEGVLERLCESYYAILLINYILIGTINEVVRILEVKKIESALIFNAVFTFYDYEDAHLF